MTKMAPAAIAQISRSASFVNSTLIFKTF